jgi:hypothetical protein
MDRRRMAELITISHPFIASRIVYQPQQVRLSRSRSPQRSSDRIEEYTSRHRPVQRGGAGHGDYHRTELSADLNPRRPR